MQQPETIPVTSICVNGVFTGCEVPVHGEPIWPPAQRVPTDEVSVIESKGKGGREDVHRKGAGASR